MLNKVAGPVVLATTLAVASTGAFAAKQIMTGDVKSTDATKHEMTLADGNTFELGSKVKLKKIKVGDKVAVTYEVKDGKMIASKVHHTKK